MARVLSFFSKKTLSGTNGADTPYYSEIFDVTDSSVLVVQLQVLGTTASASTIIGQLYESNDDSFEDASWSPVGTAMTKAGTGLSSSKVTISGPARFVRAKVTMPTGTSATVSLDGLGRQGG
jgi:hypothetical protein